MLYFVVLLAAALTVGAVFAAIVTISLVRPLRRLLGGTQAVQGGALDTELPVTSRDEVGQLTAAFNAMVRELRAKAQLRETFGRYVDPRIVEALIDRPEFLPGRGERRVMTVLFYDMKGFTALSESVTPDALVAVVNRYLAAMSGPIRRRNGIIDKYIGDAIMAFWGPPFTSADEHARLACEAALEQLERLEDVRAGLPELLGLKRGVPEIDMRVGIATGEVVVGNIGSDTAMSYTVIGDPVNLASRLEGANKVYGTRLLVSAATADMVRDALELREVDTVIAAGKHEPQQVFEVLGRKDAVSPECRALAERYAEGLAAYRRREWSDAEAAFRGGLDIMADGPCAALLSRIAHFRAHPPTEGCDGV